MIASRLKEPDCHARPTTLARPSLLGMTCKGGIAGTKVAEGNSRLEGGNSKCSSGEGGLTAVAVSGTPEEDEDFEDDLLTPLTAVAGCDTTTNEKENAGGGVL